MLSIVWLQYNKYWSTISDKKCRTVRLGICHRNIDDFVLSSHIFFAYKLHKGKVWLKWINVIVSHNVSYIYSFEPNIENNIAKNQKIIASRQYTLGIATSEYHLVQSTTNGLLPFFWRHQKGWIFGYFQKNFKSVCCQKIGKNSGQYFDWLISKHFFTIKPNFF